GRVTQYSYDALNRLLETTAPDPDSLGPETSPVTLYGYDAVGNLRTLTDASGRVTRYGYDVLDRRIEVIDARGGRSTIQYDAVGNVTAVTDALGRVTRYENDALNRLVKTTNPDPDGAQGPETSPVTQFTYDAVGNLRTQTDALGRVTIYAYAAVNRRIAPAAAEGGTSTIEYDAAGNVVAVIDPLGRG